MMRMDDGRRSIETTTLDTGRQPFYCNRRELRSIMKKEIIGEEKIYGLG